MRTSRFGRLVKLGTGLAKASTKMITTKIHAYEEIIKTMGEMKGVLMKLGQMISISEDLVLPKEVALLFAKLQNDATSMSNSDINKVFLKSFSKLPEDIFFSFDRNPIAQASIGQVHRAQIYNADKSALIQVAVKVQYPDIQEAIKSDLSNLKGIESLMELFSVNKLKIDHFLTELKESILQECDYLHEAEELVFFKEKICKEFPTIKIPGVYHSYCSKTILTQDYLAGDSFELAKNYNQEERDYLGTLLYESYLYELFHIKKIHSDPQNGNYLFRRNSIVKLDFGSTKNFDEDFILDYCLMLMSIEEGDISMYRFSAMSLHFIYKDDSEEVLIDQFNFLKRLYSPLLQEGIYSLDQVDIFSWVKDYLKRLDLSKQRSPRKEFLMLDRANLGLFTKVKQLKSRVNWKFGRDKFRKDCDVKALERYNKLKVLRNIQDTR